METPSYYAIIPASVRYDKELRPNEKLLYGEITALCGVSGYCWGSNQYFADLYGVSDRMVREWISHLKERGYIDVVMIYKEGTKEVQERRIYITSINGAVTTDPPEENFLTSGKKSPEASGKKFPDPEEKKFRDNNRRVNNTSMNNKENKKRKSEEDLKQDFEELWKLYPRKRGKEPAFKHYKRALKEGSTNEEIRQGILNLIEDIRKNKTEERYIPYGSTFFNEKSWNDDMKTETVQQTCGNNKSQEFMDFEPF